MATINLLPWREELRRTRQKDFFVLAGVAVVAMLVVVGLVHLEFDNRIQHQNMRNEYLTDKITELDEKIKKIKDLEQQKQNLLARMEIIEELQSSRPEIVHLMDEVVNTIPEGVYYLELKQVARNLDVKGVAQSNARVSSLMRNIDKSEWLVNPDLVEIRKLATKKEKEQRFSEFSLRFQQKKPKGEEAGEGAS